MAATTKSELAAQLRALQKSRAREKAKSTRVERKLAEAIAQQAATAEILRVIASSPTDVQPVFDAIASSAARLCDATFCIVFRFDGEMITVAADHGRSPGTMEVIRAAYPSPPGRQSISARAIAERRVISIADAQNIKGYPQQAKRARAIGYRSILAVPMMLGGAAIGTINVARAEAIAFSGTQIELLKSFADQAVIAIENVRLFNETREALERQTATAEILKVIASSPSDVQPVFDAIVTSALRLVGGFSATVTRIVDDMLQLAASSATHKLGDDAVRSFYPVPASRGFAGKAISTRAPVYVSDTETDPSVHSSTRELARATGFRSVVVVPMIREGAVIGTIHVRGAEPGQFSGHHLDLLMTFADQAVIAIENVRLFNETKEALERQTATAEILKVIASSPSDVQPVFDAIVKSALRLIGGLSALVTRVVGEEIHLAAFTSLDASKDDALRSLYPLPVVGTTVGEAIVTGNVQFVSDVETDARMTGRGREVARERGYRSLVTAPMIREGKAFGTINVARREAGPFTAHEIELLETFADQAVIAIENVRLFNETKEALEQQTASSEILGVISSSPTDLAPVFDAILHGATRLCDAHLGVLNLYDGENSRTVAQRGGNPEFAKWVFERGAVKPGRGMATMIAERRPVQFADAKESASYGAGDINSIKFVDLGGVRTYLAVPLVKDDRVMGAILIYRPEVRPFTDKQIELVKTFANQAVIAIENVRLFNETKEALERQTATAEILQVIASSPSDVQPVFDAIVQSTVRLLPSTSVVLTIRDGDQLRLGESAGPLLLSEATRESVRSLYPVAFDPKITPAVIAMLEGRVVETPDSEAPGVPVRITQAGRTFGWRSNTQIPLLREGQGIGSLTVVHPQVGFRLSEKQLALMKTFADQAVIAIENVRLFNETKEALERQTATAEILKVIASSPSDVQPVFDAIAGSAMQLLGGHSALVTRLVEDTLHLAALTATTESADEALRKAFPIPLSDGMSAKAARTGVPAYTSDIDFDPDYSSESRERARARGYRSIVAVPMIRDEAVIGTIAVTRREPGPFTDHQIKLLKTFADQAVIAIENVRLFNETKEALERQTATAEILRVIASSPSDVQPVFQAIAESAKRLLNGRGAVVTRIVGDMLHLAAHTATGEAGSESVRRLYPQPLSFPGINGIALRSGKPAYRTDTENDPTLPPEYKETARARGYRSQLVVPMLREGVAFGTIIVSRSAPGTFTDHQIDLLKTFADQAVIAIENVRLFNETKEALERQTATAEILKVISSSPTNVQPVLDAIVQTAVRLFSPWNAVIAMRQGNMIDIGAMAGSDIAKSDMAELAKIFPAVFDPEKMLVAVAIRDRRLIEIPDTENPPGEYPFVTKAGRAGKYRSAAFVPLIREDEGIGAIVLTNAALGSRLTANQLALVRTFADQAVIAIENVRLFKELQARTEALTQSVGQLTALGEVGQAISSTLDLETVLKTIVARAVQLTGLDGGSIYEYDERAEEFRLRADENLSDEIIQMLRDTPIRKGEGPVGRAAVTGEPTQIPEMLDDSYQSPRRELLIRAGFRALLVVPLLRENHVIGALSVTRKSPGAFAPEIVELLKTFATQSAMAIQNARLFREIEDKGRQLEVASQHKSQFLASMSHELRTPLNAILGFNEMILDQVYGEVSPDVKAPLENMQASGKHLLRLINNVLDLAKIEAGRMELALADYAVQDAVESVRQTLLPLAAEKGLALRARAPGDIPLAYGDGGRITQCLMNLAGNSLKFTKAGKVEISVEEKDGLLTYRVADTGIGIPPDKIASLFTEFKQTDATIASEYGGTGLGLSISKKFVEMHGGRIWVESEPGKGSAFIFEIPLRAGTP